MCIIHIFDREINLLDIENGTNEFIDLIHFLLEKHNVEYIRILDFNLPGLWAIAEVDEHIKLYIILTYKMIVWLHYSVDNYIEKIRYSRVGNRGPEEVHEFDISKFTNIVQLDPTKYKLKYLSSIYPYDRECFPCLFIERRTINVRHFGPPRNVDFRIFVNASLSEEMVLTNVETGENYIVFTRLKKYFSISDFKIFDLDHGFSVNKKLRHRNRPRHTKHRDGSEKLGNR